MADFLFDHIFFLSKTGLAVLSAAVFLDLLLGDRESLPHPIRLMGAAINGSEKIARASLMPGIVSGSVMTICLVAGTYLAALFLFGYLNRRFFFLYFILSTVAVYFSISLKCLADEALNVLKAIEEGDIEEAKNRISMLVSRDTHEMTVEDISRAAIETTAENLVDGIIAPFFYAAVGGAPLCLCFKMISTLDSMIGYRNETYQHFGRLAARLDDVAIFIPARLSVPVTAICSIIIGSAPQKVLSCVSAFAQLHESPNSGYPESAFAGALNTRLGGRTSYDGIIHDCRVINPKGKEPCPANIKRAVILLYASSLALFSVFLIPGLVLVF